jgi:hypothetical protein
MKIVGIILLVVAAMIGGLAYEGHASLRRAEFAARDIDPRVHFTTEGAWNQELVIAEDNAPVSDATLAYLAVFYYSDRFRAQGFKTVREGQVIEKVR